MQGQRVVSASEHPGRDLFGKTVKTDRDDVGKVEYHGFNTHVAIVINGQSIAFPVERVRTFQEVGGMTNEEYCNLPYAESSTTVLLKPGQPHPVYYGPVKTTRKRGDYSHQCEYWFLYQNKPRRCVPGQATGFVEV